ncbi:alpha/beta fold hydrolase [Halocatena halophila]|uniref:alpha/beta fold hydrolase n=1 Tax=Halocatena halophila TaxID=2814576 RepID=UPI002ED1A824
MRMRKILTGAAGSLGLVAGTNKLLQRQAGTLPTPLGRATDEYRWRGFDVSYTEAGDPSDPDLVLIHGVNAAATSAEFAGIFDALAESYHVFAPDLPGFGLSDRPPLAYSASLYTTFVEEFLEELTDEPTVVGASLGGAYAAIAATETPVSELFLICPTTTTMPGNRTWLRSLLRSPLLGEGLFNLTTSRKALDYFSADHGLFDPSVADDEYIEYRWESAHQPGARYAPASFLSGALDPAVDLSTTLATIEQPCTLIWGRDASTSPLSAGESLAAHADAKLAVFDEAQLLPHVEHPDGVVSVLTHSDDASAYFDG